MQVLLHTQSLICTEAGEREGEIEGTGDVERWVSPKG